MSRLYFRFKREWIEEKKKQYGSPVRKMERFIGNQEEVKLIKSSNEGFTVELNEESRDGFVGDIVEYIKETFEENRPWFQMTVSGDTKGMNIQKKKEDEEGSGRGQGEESEKSASDQEKGQKKGASDQDGESEKDFSSQEEELPKKQSAHDGAVREEFLKKLCCEVPARYSREIQSYFQELVQVIPMLTRLGAAEQLWSQELLISVDNGFGLTAFLQLLCKIYRNYGLCAQRDMNKNIREIEVAYRKIEEAKYEAWEELLELAQEFAKTNQREPGKRLILCMDISEWQSELSNTRVKNYLRRIHEVSANFICVFRIPFMERHVIGGIEEHLRDIMGLRTLIVSPMSLENMTDYVKNKLKQAGFAAETDCDELLERWILKEKGSGSFFGYKTLDKIVSQVIYQKALLNCADDTENLCVTASDILVMLDEPELLENPYDLLQRLIGMEKMKQKIREIITQIKTQKELLEQGKKIERPSIHMIFTGNPGTGKTTIARIIARMMKEEGVLRKGYFYEIKGRELCGRYVGETAPKTSAYCRDAYGSILFIDEAYGLYQREMGGDYGKEALQTLIAEMENHRDDFCVIMAGYKEEMQEMLKWNPGLESRIPYVIEFPNYTREELESIFFEMLDASFEYEENLTQAAHEFFSSLSDGTMKSKSFSNARMVRNLFERTWGKAAYRRSMSKETELVIKKEDFTCALHEEEFQELLKDKKQHIGFSAIVGK